MQTNKIKTIGIIGAGVSGIGAARLLQSPLLNLVTKHN